MPHQFKPRRFKPFITFHAAAVLALLIAAPSAFADVEISHSEKSFDLASGRTLEVEIPVGEVIVEGTSGHTVRAELRVKCNQRTGKCADLAKKLTLVTREKGDTVHLEIDGWPKMGGTKPNVTVTLEMPRGSALEFELGVGDLKITGMASDLDIEVGVGHARIEMAESAVRAVDLEIGVGDAELRPRQKSADSSGFLGFLGKEISWDEGKGEARIHVEVGVGDADVVLE